MKKNLLTLVMVTAAIGAMAMTPQAAQRLEARKADTKLEAPAQARMSRSMPTDVITETPAGQSVYCTVDATGYEQNYWGEGVESLSGEKYYGQLVRGDNGDVYYSNFIPAYPIFNFVKGVEKDGEITFQLPQCLYEGYDYDGSPLYLYAQILDVVGDYDVTATVNPDVTSVSFTVTNTGLVANIPEGQMLGITYADGSWTNYGVLTMNVTEMKGVEKITAPENAQFESWQFLFSSDGLVADHGVLADVAIVGDELYVKNILEGMPEATFKAKIEGGKAVFESDQYMGGEPYMGSNVFMTAAYGEVEEGDIFPWFFKRDSMTFSFDESTKTFESEVGYGLFGNIGQRDEIYYYYLYSYANPIIKPYDPNFEPAMPKGPIYVGMMEYMPDYGMGQIYFYLPSIDVNNNMLDTDRLYYNYYVDEDLYTLGPDEYEGLETEITDIPWSYTDPMYEVYGYGVYRYFTFKVADFDVLSIQSFYLKEDGTRLYSDTMNVYADGSSDITGISKVENAPVQVLSVEYFDLQGRKLAAPVSGTIVVQKAVLSDGTVKCAKKIIK